MLKEKISAIWSIVYNWISDEIFSLKTDEIRMDMDRVRSKDLIESILVRILQS